MWKLFGPEYNVQPVLVERFRASSSLQSLTASLPSNLQRLASASSGCGDRKHLFSPASFSWSHHNRLVSIQTAWLKTRLFLIFMFIRNPKLSHMFLIFMFELQQDSSWWWMHSFSSWTKDMIMFPLFRFYPWSSFCSEIVLARGRSQLLKERVSSIWEK